MRQQLEQRDVRRRIAIRHAVAARNPMLLHEFDRNRHLALRSDHQARIGRHVGVDPGASGRPHAPGQEPVGEELRRLGDHGAVFSPPRDVSPDRFDTVQPRRCAESLID